MPGIDRLGEQATRHRLRILLLALEATPDLGDLPAELLGSERRRQQHLGEEVEAEGHVLLQHGEGHGGTIVARAGLEAATDELDDAVQLGAAAPRRAASEERGSEVGE